MPKPRLQDEQSASRALDRRDWEKLRQSNPEVAARYAVRDVRVNVPPPALKAPWDYRDGKVYVAMPIEVVVTGPMATEPSYDIAILDSDGQLVEKNEFDAYPLDANWARQYVDCSHEAFERMRV